MSDELDQQRKAMEVELSMPRPGTQKPGTSPSVIGLTGKMGAGKDTALERLQHLFGANHYRKASFAEPLKESAAALFGVTTEMLEAWKNEPTIRISVLDLRGAGRDLGRSFSVREILQRYGTEAHRDVFGQNFWVDVAMRRVAEAKARDHVQLGHGVIDVFTDVRFENEARAIRDAGGLIYGVRGPNADTGDHASEAGIPDGYVEWDLDNTLRPTYEQMSAEPALAAQAMQESLAQLDDEVSKLHAELQELAR